MPSNGRWRHIKIVEASHSRAQEISGGLKNALDRGETLAKAKQSFINSGYTPKEVQTATRMVKSSPSRIAKPLPSSSRLQPAPSQPVLSEKTSSKKTIIILSIVGAAILIVALTLGLFWDKIFG